MKYKTETKQLCLMTLLLTILIVGILGYQLYDIFKYAPISLWSNTSAFIV